MMILKTIFYSTILSLLINSTAFSFSGTDFPPPPSPTPVLPPFHKISCTDNLSVRLTGTIQAPSLFIHHQPKGQTLVSQVVDGTLYLSVEKKQDNKPTPQEPMDISLQSGPLEEIAVNGNCKVDTFRLQTYGIVLIAMGSGKIYMDGYGDIKVSKIIAQNQGRVEVIWADSPQLFINAFDTSSVKIAGIANEILLRAYGQAEIDAQYLRTCRVNAFTKSQGFAEVLPLCELRAFSEGQGRIDYYTVPRNAMLVTQSSGNVLWMGYRN